jgi:hypothetical protein
MYPHKSIIYWDGDLFSFFSFVFILFFNTMFIESLNFINFLIYFSRDYLSFII